MVTCIYCSRYIAPGFEGYEGRQMVMDFDDPEWVCGVCIRTQTYDKVEDQGPDECAWCGDGYPKSWWEVSDPDDPRIVDLVCDECVQFEKAIAEYEAGNATIDDVYAFTFERRNGVQDEPEPDVVSTPERALCKSDA